MIVTFKEYKAFGYDLIPKKVFPKIITRAGLTVEQRTLGRVTEEWLANPGADIPPELVKRNKRGICEIADLYFTLQNKPVGEAGAVIKSFSNEGYSETLADTTGESSRLVLENDVAAVMDIFFTPEQLFRGVGW